MVYNYVIGRCLRNLTGNGKKVNFYNFLQKKNGNVRDPNLLKNMKFSKKLCYLLLSMTIIGFSMTFQILMFGVVAMICLP